MTQLSSTPWWDRKRHLPGRNSPALPGGTGSAIPNANTKTWRHGHAPTNVWSCACKCISRDRQRLCSQHTKKLPTKNRTSAERNGRSARNLITVLSPKPHNTPSRVMCAVPCGKCLKASQKCSGLPRACRIIWQCHGRATGLCKSYRVSGVSRDHKETPGRKQWPRV